MFNTALRETVTALHNSTNLGGEQSARSRHNLMGRKVSIRHNGTVLKWAADAVFSSPRLRFFLSPFNYDREHC